MAKEVKSYKATVGGYFPTVAVADGSEHIDAAGSKPEGEDTNNVRLNAGDTVTIVREYDTHRNVVEVNGQEVVMPKSLTDWHFEAIK